MSISEKCVVSIKCCKGSTDDLVANDPAFLKRMAKRLKALTHAIPFSLSGRFHLIQVDSHLRASEKHTFLSYVGNDFWGFCRYLH